MEKLSLNEILKFVLFLSFTMDNEFDRNLNISKNIFFQCYLDSFYIEKKYI